MYSTYRRALLAALVSALIPLSASAAPAVTSPPADLVVPLIIGGEDAEPGQYPFMVSLQRLRRGDSDHLRHSCGATLISPSWVLTAAHCVDDVGAKDLAAATRLHTLDTTPRRRASNVKAIHVHPAYDPSTLVNDVALIRLKRPVANAETADVLLKNDGVYLRPGRTFTVTGWGVTDMNADALPTVLQTVQVPFVPFKECSEAYPDLQKGTAICAGAEGMDSCQGDSGGPLMVQRKGRWTVLGTVSWGEGCALPGLPGVYARLSTGYVRDFIQATWTGD
ncbi:serine protease [Stenotrophomonas sp.]|uniref:S1 family peptidase n=1 Tax=Stenotrophomonas sp. TaxID=69392 RepID=UPI002898294D|nr:serine protease [Stenotrophomonas sp.]